MGSDPFMIIQFQVLDIISSGVKLIYGLGNNGKIYVYDHMTQTWETQTENKFS